MLFSHIGFPELLIIVTVLVLIIVIAVVSRGSRRVPPKRSMTAREIGTLFVQFSDVPDSQRETFLEQHPEILYSGMVDWALVAAQMREPDDKKRIADAALYIAKRLGDAQRQAAAHEILTEAHSGPQVRGDGTAEGKMTQYCPSCGRETPEGSQFCLNCGTRLAMPTARASTQQAASTITCPKCNHSNPTDIKFCQKCGTSLTVVCRRCGSQNALTTEFCGNCGVKLSEATFGIPRNEIEKWQETFKSLGWFEELGPRTKQILPQLQPPLDTSKEQILFVTYSGASNHIQDVRVDDVNLRRTYIGAIGTNWRIIFLDTDKMRLYAFPYEDLATVEKPAGGGIMKDANYILRTKSGHSVSITVRLDAPGMVGLIAGFGNPITAGQVLSHGRRAKEVIEFLNLYFTCIVP